MLTWKNGMRYAWFKLCISYDTRDAILKYFVKQKKISTNMAFMYFTCCILLFLAHIFVMYICSVVRKFQMEYNEYISIFEFKNQQRIDRFSRHYRLIDFRSDNEYFTLFFHKKFF